MTDGLRREDGLQGSADALYGALLRAHEGLTGDESAALHARLVLILSNQIGDLAILQEAIAAARRSLRPTGTEPTPAFSG